MHTILAFLLSQDLTSIFDNDLIWCKASIASDTISSVDSFENLNANIVLVAVLDSLSQPSKSTISALLSSEQAIVVVALVVHHFIDAILVTTNVFPAETCRVFLELVNSPELGCIPNEHILVGLLPFVWLWLASWKW